MKKLLIGIIVLLFINQVKAQDIAGSWQGLISIGGTNLHQEPEPANIWSVCIFVQ